MTHAYFKPEKTSDYCKNANDCTDYSAQLTIAGAAGAQYSAHGTAMAPPTDPSWQSCSVGGSGDDVLAMCRAIPAILNVSGSTSGGPVTVTLTGTTSGDPKYKPITMYVEFYGNTRVELEQTDWSVRPRDARDKAADCDTYWRDCWPSGSHWAWLKGIRSGLLTGQDLNPISPVFELKLEPPAYRNGKWLAGTSTNFGQDKEDVPDYIFEAGENSPYYTISPGGLSISNRGTIDAEANLANVTVTSRDYGGVANLKLTVTLGSPANGPGFGVPIPTDEVWGILPGGSASGKVPPPDPKCGTGAFASLPVDYDCNGIADSWEAQYANTLLGAGLDHFLDTSIDTDRGNQGNATPVNLQGDGLPVHDEYRGFHVRSPQTGEATWISTNPTRQDLFYWNVDRIGKTSLDKWGQAVFARVLGTTTHDFMDIHAVDKLQSNGNSGAVPYSTKPEDEATPINKNSLYLAQHKAYAVIYKRKELDKGVLGQSGVVGTLNGRKQIDFALKNAGTPMFIDATKIATLESAQSLPSGSYLAAVIVHETGHKLTRGHPLRCAAPVPYNPSGAQGLSLGQFMQGGSSLLDFYVRYSIYAFAPPPPNGIQKSERALWPDGYTFPDPSQEQPTPSSGITPPSWIYRLRTSSNIPKASRVGFRELAIQTQEGRMMDWTLDLRLIQGNGPWAWADRDKDSLCLKPNGCLLQPKVWPGCTDAFYR